MKTFKISCILLCFMFLMSCSENPLLPEVGPIMEDNATVLKGTKPEAKLVGTTIEFFSPSTLPYIWVGTIDFSDNEGYGIYNIAYKIVEMSGNPNAQAGFFREYFYIYEGENPDVGDVYLSGINEGVIVRGTNFYTHGEVEMAAGPFEGWCGRKLHVNGEVTNFDDSGNPLSLNSTFRLN